MSTPLRVLIVEDSADDAELMLHALRRGDFEPEWERVEKGPEMEEALKRQDWDVVLSDYHLPGFSAPAAYELLRRLELDIPFIVVSGAMGEDTAGIWSRMRGVSCVDRSTSLRPKVMWPGSRLRSS